MLEREKGDGAWGENLAQLLQNNGLSMRVVSKNKNYDI